IEEEATSLCYLPDHEPALVGSLDELEPEWISGYSLAHDATLLLHDCQYTDEEYPKHYGWGHSSVGHLVRFADRTNAERTLLFHHDPVHSDEELDAMFDDAQLRWREAGRGADGLGIAAEGDDFIVAAPR